MQPRSKSVGTPAPSTQVDEAKIALVGPPNVGKSALFNALTGRYVIVSNYPGTTIEVTRGRATLEQEAVNIVDTPGTYSLLSVGGDERVTQKVLLEDAPDIVVNVIDAKALERMLPLTLQLLELGLPLLVVVNMMDEADTLGIEIDLDALGEWLGVPIVATAATKGRGIEEVRQKIRALAAADSCKIADERLRCGKPICDALASLDNASTFPSGAANCSGAKCCGKGGEPAVAMPHAVRDALLELTKTLAPVTGACENRARAIASLLLQGDREVAAGLQPDGAAALEKAESLRLSLEEGGEDPTIAVMRRYHDASRAWVAENVKSPRNEGRTLADRAHQLAITPLTGIPLLLIVLYVGLYGFVGLFGAGVVVHWLEDDLFGDIVIPWVDSGLFSALPGEDGWRYWVRELIGGHYGLVSLGLTYAIAIVLPIVSLFFLFFSALEDSGYFPRLALLVDRLFKRIGLNGRAVIPIVLGFACDTMATLVTRVQETRREKIITTFLLALAVPCSAQYGVMVAVLAGRGAGFAGISYAFLAWAFIVAGVFIVAGLLASKLVPGESPRFYMELPPMRMPRPGHVLVKTFARMKWYFLEVLPLFLLASLLIWVGRLTGVFDLVISGLAPLVGLLGLPEATSDVFLYGFFRRDFGAAGLFDLTGAGLLDTSQLLIAAVTLTLFMPCIAQVLVMLRERGPKVTIIVVLLVLCIAFTAGLLVRGALTLLGGMT